MKWANNLRYRTVRSIHGMILGAALIGPISKSSAQPPQASAANIPMQNYTRSLSFHLPVSIDAETRATLGAIQLHVKTPTGPWKMQQSGPPSLTRFNCRVQQEGEYWYSLVMVDKAGRKTPADVAHAAPLQRIVVDTTPPAIQVQPVTSPDGEYCLRCTVQDANPDPLTWRAICKTDAGDVPLETLANYPGVFRVKGAEPMKFPVVISAADLAKNVGTREVNVRDLIHAALYPESAPVQQGPEILPASAGPPSTAAPQPARSDGSTAAQPSAGPKLDIGAKNEGPVAPSVVHRADSAPVNATTPGTVVPAPLPATINDEQIVRTQAQSPDTAGRAAGPIQLLNTRQANVEYRIDQVGTSGVGRVEVYMTPDQGQTWHRLGEDLDKRSPADINLPGDGVFGIRIAISNGNGFGGRPPVRGDAPQCTIEVDTTPPFVQLRSAEFMPSNGEVEIRWNATDKNLGPAPINLFYRTRLESPWQPVARNLKNDGVYRWAFPRDSSSQLFFMIQATDQAGNAAQDVTRQPILIDTSEPRATVLGVTGAGSKAVRVPPGGN